MVFKRQFDSVVIPTCSGSDIKDEFQRRFDDHGNAFLVKVGETNIDDVIQSYAQETDINYILKRFVNGDESILQRSQGIYFDSTGLPKNLADAFKLMNDAKSTFEGLPHEIASQFDSLDDFLSSFSSVDGFSRLNDMFLSVMNKKDENGSDDQPFEGGV